MTVVPVSLQPTFPLDSARIVQLKREMMWRSPQLFVAQLLAHIAGSLELVGVVDRRSANRLVVAWRNRHDELTARAVRQLILESNVVQDEHIRSMIRDLEQNGKAQYSVCLGKFLLLKQNIESDLHRCGKLTLRKQEIESLTDSVCQEVCNEIYKIATLCDQIADALTSREAERLTDLTDRINGSHARILRAYITLADTAEQLRAARRVYDCHKREDSTVLDRLLDNLREENAISRVVDERIKAELAETESEN